MLIFCNITDLKSWYQSIEIMEEQPDDYPYKSYLILGAAIDHKFMRIICAIGNDVLWIITEYFPGTKEWENDLKTRKKV